jgi:hypothetical protein
MRSLQQLVSFKAAMAGWDDRSGAGKSNWWRPGSVQDEWFWLLTTTWPWNGGYWWRQEATEVLSPGMRTGGNSGRCRLMRVGPAWGACEEVKFWEGHRRMSQHTAMLQRANLVVSAQVPIWEFSPFAVAQAHRYGWGRMAAVSGLHVTVLVSTFIPTVEDRSNGCNSPEADIPSPPTLL